MKKIVCLIVALLLCFTALGERTVYAAEPVLTVSKKTIYVGTDYQIRFKNLASDATVTYKSSNKKVATVNSKGVVTPVAKGTATLTVVIKQGGKSYTRKLALTVKNPFVWISNKKTTLVLSSDYQLVGQAYGPKNPEYSFTSSNVLVAKVDKSTGMLHARGVGKTTITMKDTSSGLSTSFKLTVVEKNEDNLTEIYISTKNFDAENGYRAPKDTSKLSEEEKALVTRLTEIQKRITAGQSITIGEMTDYYLYK